MESSWNLPDKEVGLDIDTLGDGIEAACVQRITASESPQAHPHATRGAVPSDGISHVLAAGGVESAG